MNTIYLPIELKGEHWTISVISLNAFTDDIDTPVHKNEFHLFRGMVAEKMEGNIFFLENQLEGDAYVILADCADYEKATLTVREYKASIDANTAGVEIIPCKAGQCEETCRKTYRVRMHKAPLVAMSNTWGDYNGFSRVCEEFILKEIDKAAQLGIDVVQIDDGWQEGSTADKSRRDETGRRIFADDFWVLSTQRFPHGMKYISDYAAQKGIRLGLWFAPENRDRFACLDRDTAILKNAYDNWGIRFFKLDMYWIMDDEDRDLFLKFLANIYAFGPDVTVQLDVTRHSRVNYLCGREFGTVFVENRYTKSHTYFPHRTLKNLWLLSRYIPASRFQFEVVNPALNKESYTPEDSFATPNYDIDYLFASVMLSNPLFWMEMQFLSAEDSQKLQTIVSFWKTYRTVFSDGDISPIGQKPCGRGFTGFYIKHNSKEYALIFREVTEKDTGVFCLPTEGQQAEVLLSNTAVTASLDSSVLKASFSKSRAYAFLKLQ